jgi:2-iminobutanoate/2-iminopropanoate deaminase
MKERTGIKQTRGTLVKKQIINPPELFDSMQYGFAQMTVAPALQKTVHLSGQVAWDKERNIVGKGDMYSQVLQSLANIETALTYVGGNRQNIVSMRLYIKYSHISEGKAISTALKEFFGDEPPCTTWIGVPGLANEDFLLEIEPTIVM